MQIVTIDTVKTDMPQHMKTVQSNTTYDCFFLRGKTGNIYATIDFVNFMIVFDHKKDYAKLDRFQQLCVQCLMHDTPLPSDIGDPYASTISDLSYRDSHPGISDTCTQYIQS